MDLGDITDFENAGDASERHDLVMKLASEGDHLILQCMFCTKSCVVTGCPHEHTCLQSFRACQRFARALHL
jgi:hypothetical protein